MVGLKLPLEVENTTLGLGWHGFEADRSVPELGWLQTKSTKIKEAQLSYTLNIRILAYLTDICLCSVYADRYAALTFTILSRVVKIRR